MIKALPNLKSLSQELSHVVLLYDGSKDGYCFLGLGCKKSLEIGGDISELDVLNAVEKFSDIVPSKTYTMDEVGHFSFFEDPIELSNLISKII